MSTVENSITDLESGRGRRQRRRRRRRRTAVAGSSETTTTDGSLCFSDESDRDRSWHSPLGSTAGGSLDESRFSEIQGGSETYVFDLESGELDVKVHSGIKEKQRECRICHMKLVGGRSCGDEDSGGEGIVLGCSCKGDLAAAHKQCAETWFKIRGNTTCEICGATAHNVVGEQTNEGNSTIASSTAARAAPAVIAETRSFWNGRRVMNTLLSCMVFAFVISWLFHFNVLT